VASIELSNLYRLAMDCDLSADASARIAQTTCPRQGPHKPTVFSGVRLDSNQEVGT
jgi:hypothetical protein